MVDSDFEISDDDDDLYADNLDEDEPVERKEKMKQKTATKDKGVVGEGKEENMSDYESEGEDLWAPDSDDEMQTKFRAFRKEDLTYPKFHVGQVFENVDLLSKAIKEYSCKNRVDVKLPTNDRKRVKVVCDDDCTWYLWASYDSRTKCFMVKKYVEEHSCCKKWKIKAFTAPFLASKYLESFRADQDMNLRNFSRVVQKEWHMTPTRSKLQRARRLAMKIIHGDEEGQYKLFWDYGNEIRRSNPGSSFFLALNNQARFNKAYMCLDACKRGYLQGCRPMIFIDGCHIKTRYIGQLLVAVGIDPNNCIFPIAIGVVEVEDKPNWVWFLERLNNDLCIINTSPWTVMSDKQKGLINVVTKVFPESEHRFCVRHMWKNFQELYKDDALKNQLWKIARSTTVIKYEQYMLEMKVLNEGAYNWLKELEPNTWVRAFQSDIPKCDILLNNLCEVFNKYILEARELPILSMFERIKQ
ncbi:protein FAR-RED IMPAIRED RESPONSE 1-like [Aegilops tauschii subsp. strangulata]|uniref:protein FAR-RED IMPAIRED RESPONSE 1-like n=1 Tax=Aegilops tauschii subsp. strangulata TaxID=200361 RepID=UPI00098A0EF1|nr:protein FAR1-RELATED SEQUENCE 6-like [Aegilops tauschii subsp. strangulata]